MARTIGPTICDGCAALLPLEARFCPSCGVSISSNGGAASNDDAVSVPLLDVFGTTQPESPPKPLLVKNRPSRKRLVLLGGGVAAAMAVAGLTLVMTDGQPARQAPATTLAAAPTTAPPPIVGAVQPPPGLTGTALAPTEDGSLLSFNLADGSRTVTPLDPDLDDRWRTWTTAKGLVAVAADGQLAAAATDVGGHPGAFTTIGRADRLVGAPDGAWIVGMEMDGSDDPPLAITLVDGKVTWIELILPPAVEIGGVAGGRLVAVGGGHIALLDPRSGVSTPVAPGQLVAASAGRVVRVVCNDAVTCTLRIGTWEEPDQRILPLPEDMRGVWGTTNPMTLSPDGRYLAGIDLGWNDQRVRIVDLDNGTVRSVASGGWSGPFAHAVFTPDSKAVIHLADPRGDGAATLVVSPVTEGPDVVLSLTAPPPPG